MKRIEKESSIRNNTDTTSNRHVNVGICSQTYKNIKSRPMEYDTNLTVSNPAYACDNDNSTCAEFTRNTDGYFEVKNFTKSRGKISRVDFKMRYSARPLGSVDDAYRILYLVDSSSVELEGWTTDWHIELTEVWESQPEPNDGVWDWNDIGNITFRVEIDNVGDPDDAFFRAYEAWVTVYIDYPFVSVDPSEILDATLVPGEQFTIDIVVDYVEKLSAYQFEMSFNPEVLHGVSYENGPFLSSAGGSFIFFPGQGFDNTAGFLYLFGAILNPPDQKNPTGGSDQFGPLATVTFEVVGVGSSPLTLGEESGLFDSYGKRIVDGEEFPTCLKHGYFDNTPSTNPMEVLKELIQMVESWSLGIGIETSLTSKLQLAYFSLGMENQNASMGQLTAFICQVEALRENKLSNDKADYLVSEAQRIIDLIQE